MPPTERKTHRLKSVLPNTAILIMRLFVAMDIPEDVPLRPRRTRCQAAPSRTEKRAGRESRGFHVTLKFIGETAPEKTEAIKAALASISSRDLIPINFVAWAFYTNDRRPRVLWSGVEAGADLAQLAAAVETSNSFR